MLMEEFSNIISQLKNKHSLGTDEYRYLLSCYSEEKAHCLAQMADGVRRDIYGLDIYVRGLIEISNICANDCLYCGIRRSNMSCLRYRLSPHEIIDCCNQGYTLGFRTFVLQGGEDEFFTDEVLCDIIHSIKSNHPDCAITLSLGERSYDSYCALYQAGADRYLLRHETATEAHYKQLHPDTMSFSNRMDCLHNLREIGYAVGCGFMVGSPYQTMDHLVAELEFIEEFQPDMCGIGPFIPHSATPFSNFSGGTAEMTCYLLSIIRLIKPNILLPATTALGTIHPQGRELGIQSGANVVMPNLSPVAVRKKYELYDNKICTGEESAQCLSCLSERINRAGYNIVISRGDAITI